MKTYEQAIKKHSYAAHPVATCIADIFGKTTTQVLKDMRTQRLANKAENRLITLDHSIKSPEAEVYP